MTTEEQKENKRTAILLGLVVILLAVIVTLLIVYIRATHPMSQAKKEAVKIAEEHAQLDSVDKFYWFNRKETYFSLTGKNSDGTAIVVIIPEKGGDVTEFNQDEGLNEGQAKQVAKERYGANDIQKVTLGMFDNKAVWEITDQTKDGRFNYYLIAFENGDEVKVIQGI